MTKELDELKAELKACRDTQRPMEEELSRLREEEQSLQLKIAEVEFGARVGAVVLYRGKRHRVTTVKPWRDGKPWVQGNPTKKDGTFGTAERQLFSDWTLEPKEARAGEG